MKIISKYKDGYDYLMGIYGIDPLIVLDRTTGSVSDLSSSTRHFCLIIGGFKIDGMCINGNFYYGDDLALIGEIPTKRPLPFSHADIRSDLYYNVRVDNDCYRVSGLIVEDKSNINKIEGAPILVGFYRWNGQISDYTKYPRLTDFNLFSYLDAEKVYHMISNYISSMIDEKQSNIAPITNSNKIINKGFDLKTSFRPKMG